MLVRIVIKNLFSFNEEREFNLLPSPRYTRLSHHNYKINEIDILKLSAIYGANGAGKSNLIKAIYLLIEIVLSGEIPSLLGTSKFKLSSKCENNPQIIGIEFLINNKTYYYAVEIDGGIFLTEELYEIDNNKKELLIFERKTVELNKTQIKFDSNFEQIGENLTLKNVLEKTLTKPEKSIFKLLNELENDYLNDIKQAFKWFSDVIQVILPNSKPRGLVQKIELESGFREFADDIMSSFGTGVRYIGTEVKQLKEVIGDDDNYNKISKELLNNPKSIFGLVNKSGEELIAVNENNQLLVKRLVLKHKDDNNKYVNFYMDNESDGTNRLLDYLPVFQHIISESKVYIIDEIERSIHPLLIKELIKKFSTDKESKGQLIFTTHESNLLDQEIFRQDEIWFIEKDNLGSSDMYPLSEFKEHHTIDIKKGYLNGRYGAVPFLSNLTDLNWTKYAITK